MAGQNSELKKNQPQGSKNGYADHRYLPRWTVQNRILYKLENDNRTQECSSRDLSCSGACLLTPQSLPKNQNVKLTIFLTPDQKVDVEGKILWNKPYEGENLAGILFHNTSEKAQELILKHAFEIKKEALLQHWFKGWNK